MIRIYNILEALEALETPEATASTDLLEHSRLKCLLDDPSPEQLIATVDDGGLARSHPKHTLTNHQTPPVQLS